MAQALNTFEGGLMMDLHPLTTPNSVLTNCLNGTFLTFNGNEYILQNDMGNGRVETAYLPSGYIPIGTTSFGGIIYIVSYNPLNNKCLIGCFPSPERNISEEDTTSSLSSATIKNGDFKDGNSIINRSVRIKLSEIKLNPGDKYIISATNLDDNISDYNTNSTFIGENPKYVRLRVATTDSSGKLIYIDSNIKWYDKYYMTENGLEDNDIKSYRKDTSSEYSIYDSKISGELYIVAQLEAIDTFGYSYTATRANNGNFNLTLIPEWSCENWNDNRDINPKYIKIVDSDTSYKEISEINKNENVNTTNIIYKSNYDPNNLTDSVLNFEITPCMKYGELSDLSLRDSIDFSLIGDGKAYINKWQYYISDDSILLRYGILANPEVGYSFTGLEMSFYNVNNLISQNSIEIESATPDYIYVNSGRSSYSGIFNLEIPSDNLDLNNLYIVKINLLYNEEYSEKSSSIVSTGYLMLFASGIFNDHYINNDEEIFTNLNLEKDGNISYSVSLESNINSINSTLSDLVVPNLNISSSDKDLLKNETLGETIYKINDSEFTITPKIEFSSDLFTADPTITITLGNKGTSMVAEKTITCDSVVNNTSKSDTDVLEELLDNGDLTITDKGNNRYSLNLTSGVKIYSYEQQLTNVSYQGRFIPLLYTQSDLTTYGLSQYGDDGKHFYYDQIMALSGNGYIDFMRYSRENGVENEYQDMARIAKYCDTVLNGNQRTSEDNQLNKSDEYQNYLILFCNEYYPTQTIIPFVFTSGSKKSYTSSYWEFSTQPYLFGNESNLIQIDEYKNIWNRERAVRRYKDSDDLVTHKMYNFKNYINSNLTPVLIKDATVSSDPFGTETFGLLIKSNNGTYLMSNNFALMNAGDSSFVERLGGMDFSVADVVAAFLMQTYKYDTENVTQEEYRPSQIVYLPSYTLNFNIEFLVNSTLSEENIKFNGNYLSTILEYLKNIQSNLSNNITFESKTDFNINLKEYIQYSTTITDQLYNKYTSDTSDKVLIVNTVNSAGIAQTLILNNNVSLSENKLYALNYNNNEMYDLATVSTSSKQIHPGRSYYKKVISKPCYKMITFTGNRINDNGILVAKYDSTAEMNPYGLHILLNSDEGLIINLTKYISLNKTSLQGTIEVNGDPDSKDDKIKIQNIATDFSLSKYLTCYF